jgi:hypothetical protein
MPASSGARPARGFTITASSVIAQGGVVLPHQNKLYLLILRSLRRQLREAIIAERRSTNAPGRSRLDPRCILTNDEIADAAKGFSTDGLQTAQQKPNRGVRIGEGISAPRREQARQEPITDSAPVAVRIHSRDHIAMIRGGISIRY